MKKIAVDITAYLSIGDLHYIEDFVNEYTDESVIEQALEGVSEEDLQKAYYEFMLEEFVRESIFTGRRGYENLEVLISELD